MRAQLIHFETWADGSVLSTSPITFRGNLSHNGYANPISCVLENVVRRFTT